MANKNGGLASAFDFGKVQPPSWGHSSSLDSSSQVIVEAVVYKLTRIPGVVVQRGAALFKDRCVTYHDPYKKTDATTWMLDRSCTLLPASPSELVLKRRGIRPKGKWAITAAVQGVETYLDVFEIKICWPPSWAAAGYTDLVLGFTDQGEALCWHEALSRVLEELGAPRRQQQGQALSSTSPCELVTMSAPVVQLETNNPVQPAATCAASDDEVRLASTQSSPLGTQPDAVRNACHAERTATSALDDDNISDLADEDEEGEDPSASDDQCWIPYRQTNGVAIYYHASDGHKPGEATEGEYMVSCVIRGQPHRVAAALMRLRSNTTLLGPAAHVEVLQPADEKTGIKKEVLRLVLTAAGNAGYFCAPREVILERMRKEEEGGVIVILFKSVDLVNETEVRGTSNLYGTGLYRRPVRAKVAGGYTIAGLRGEGQASAESLVTCIVKVDLGGVCSVTSWARPFASAAGWVDNFMDRILMSVHLLRDEVEQRRFSVQPFKLVASAKARLNEDGDVVSQQTPVGTAELGKSSASLTRIPRLTARMASMRFTGGSDQMMPTNAGVNNNAIKEMGDIISSSIGSVDIASFHLNLSRVQSLTLLSRKYWTEVQVPGTDAPFRVRGSTYLKDKKKVLAGAPAFNLGGVELIELPVPGTIVAGVPSSTGVVPHICRFMPNVREGGAPFSIIIALVIPGAPMLYLASVFCCDKHPSILGTPPARPMDEPHDWQPFDFVLHKFVYGTDETRNSMLKLVPHIASGSWMIKQSVGTTPCLIGKALKTTYHCTPTYIEVDIDISANSVANYVTGMVRGATTSLDIDLAFILEGSAPWELPECLLGAFRLTRLDCKAATPLDWTQELPLTSANSSKL